MARVFVVPGHHAGLDGMSVLHGTSPGSPTVFPVWGQGGPVPCSRAARSPLPLFQPLSINGDKEYLEDLDSPGAFPLPPVIAITLCPAHGGEDVGPLPLKVDLDKTVL